MSEKKDDDLEGLAVARELASTLDRPRPDHVRLREQRHERCGDDSGRHENRPERDAHSAGILPTLRQDQPREREAREQDREEDRVGDVDDRERQRRRADGQQVRPGTLTQEGEREGDDYRGEQKAAYGGGEGEEREASRFRSGESDECKRRDDGDRSTDARAEDGGACAESHDESERDERCGEVQDDGRRVDPARLAAQGRERRARAGTRSRDAGSRRETR